MADTSDDPRMGSCTRKGLTVKWKGNRMNKTSFLGMVGLLTAASPGFGSLVGPRSVLDLERSADLIVVGTAGGAFQASPAASFSLQVSRVIKGDTTLAGSVIPIHWSGGTASARETGATMDAAGIGLWFLQRSSGDWALLPVFQGSVPLGMTFFPASASPVLSAYAYDPAAPLSDKVASEISSAIEGANGYHLQLYALHYGLLDQLQSPVVALLYQRMSNSTSTQQRILGLSGLIRGGSGTALIAAAEGAASFGSYPTETSVLLLSIRDHFRPTEPSAVAALGQTAADFANPSLAFREAAAHALAAIHSVTTLPYLATLLDAPETELRVEAIGGIGAFANGLPVQIAAGVPSLAHLQLPPAAPYRTGDTMVNFALGSQAIERNEASYLLFWKQWWSQHRTALGY
jgi:hypothetical protein